MGRRRGFRIVRSALRLLLYRVKRTKNRRKGKMAAPPEPPLPVPSLAAFVANGNGNGNTRDAKVEVLDI